LKYTSANHPVLGIGIYLDLVGLGGSGLITFGGQSGRRR